MKLHFKKLIFLILGFVFFSSLVLTKEVSSEYVIEIGNLNIGKLFWSITLDETNYKILVKLEDDGIFSDLYSFKGSYVAEGKTINGGFVPSIYKQKWKTKNKNRDVELYFINGAVSKLNLFPKELAAPKIVFLGVDNAIDPLSSFLAILKYNNSSRIIDGRRFYRMVVKERSIKNNMVSKNISIEDYQNIWADHNNNDLSSIQLEQTANDLGAILPHKIKIKYKGLVFKLSKI